MSKGSVRSPLELARRVDVGSHLRVVFVDVVLGLALPR
jgi:hypothetical protein